MIVGLELSAWLWLLALVAATSLLAGWLSSMLLWLLVGIATPTLLVFAWWLWWWLPKHQADRFRIPDAKARADIEDNFRKTAGQLIGGAALLIGAGIGATFTYLQFTKQQQAAHDLLISNQVAKGFELLGNSHNQLQQRLGGIYALEGVMNTSREYSRPVLEALCAFVREATKTTTGEGPPASDVEAALTVIKRRVAGPGYVDLRSAHIPKADLSGVIALGGGLYADYEGRPDLSFADLSHVDLTGGTLIWINLRRATLLGANLSAADLRSADLSFARLLGANLLGANLSGADLTGANLSGAKGLTKEQLEQACGENVEGLDRLDPPLDPVPTIKPSCRPGSQ